MSRSKLSAEDVAAITAAFDHGASRAELATTYGVHPNTISRLLQRSTATHRKARKRALDADEEYLVLAAYASDESVGTIAARFGVSPQLVSRTAIALGATRRRPGLPGRRRRFDQATSREIADAYRGGATLRALAAEHDAPYSAIHRELERSGVPRRRPHTTGRIAAP